MPRLRHKLAKNLPELRALATGSIPSWVTTGSDSVEGIPVFVFHGVGPERFADQLRFLVENGYRTLRADELTERFDGRVLPDPKSIVLTFDDAPWSLWSHAFPLLRHYGMTAVTFAIPGLVPKEAPELPILDLSGWTSGAPLPQLSRGDVLARVEAAPLLSWTELRAMSDAGVIDVQSHSLFHPRVQVGPRVVDFHHPQLDCDYYGNVGLPLAGPDDPRAPRRDLVNGTPVLEFASRFGDARSFVPDPTFGDGARTLVLEEGGAHFFEQNDWRKYLRESVGAVEGRYETDDERDDAIRHEMMQSKGVIETRLERPVSHFCYPWFEGSNRADQIAAESGYTASHYGLDRSFVSDQPMRGAGSIWRIPRLSEEYLERLPGQGRRSLAAIWRDRLRRRGHPRGRGI